LYGENHYITQALKHGIGIHFGDMPEQVRNSVDLIIAMRS